MGQADLTPHQVVDVLISFIRVSLEQIWYNLDIYPAESFRKYTFHHLDVYSSRHPRVIAYLDEFERAIRPMFEEGKVVRLYLEVMDIDEKSCSIGISFKNSLLFEQIRNDTQFMESNRPNKVFSSFTLINQMKAFLYSLMIETASLDKRNGNNYGDFKILLSTTDDSSVSQDENWILEKSFNSEMSKQNVKFENKDIKTIREVNIGYLLMRGYVARF